MVRDAENMYCQLLTPLMLLLLQAEFDAAVEQGFQASPTWHQGSIVAAETGTPGPPLSNVAACSWALSMTPKVGWGDAPGAAGNGSSAAASTAGGRWGSGSAAGERQQQGNALAAMLGGRSQRATAGWLSMLAVFEPHWQVGCTLQCDIFKI
jgi:tocopherol cyclase